MSAAAGRWAAAHAAGAAPFGPALLGLVVVSDPARLASLTAVRDFYESVWADASDDPEPWLWATRRALLLGEAQPGERVLDLGCGAGRFVAALKEIGADAVGVEIADAALERARRNVPGADLRLVEPGGSLPLGHGEVDLVWCSEVLEHVPDTTGFLTEARRVLKPGGRILVTVPDHGVARRTAIALARHEQHYDPLGQHLRFYTRRSLAAALEATGFDRIHTARFAPGALKARAIRA